MTIEYRVKPVTRYIVTRYGESDNQTEPTVRQIGGEHDNAEVAYQVGYALARQEAENLGYDPGDDRLKYPEHPGELVLARKPKYTLDQLLAEGQETKPAAYDKDNDRFGLGDFM